MNSMLTGVSSATKCGTDQLLFRIQFVGGVVIHQNVNFDQRERLVLSKQFDGLVHLPYKDGLVAVIAQPWYPRGVWIGWLIVQEQD